MFEELARSHADELAVAGALPEGVYGEWWTERGGQVQIDVLGLRGTRTVFAGEAKWSADPLDHRELTRLRAKAARTTGYDAADIVLGFWSRGGVEPGVEAAGVRAFVPDDLLTGATR